MTTPLIEARDVCCRLGGRAALQDVNIAFRAGSLCCLLGPNGAGKSTLLRVLTGDIAPDEGVVTFDDRPLGAWGIDRLAVRRAVMPQRPGTAFDYLGADVALLGRYPHCDGRPGRRDHAVVAQALETLDASRFASRIVTTLSGGENARVHFARALAQVAFETDGRQRALFLDEPTASLDLAHQHQLMREVRALAHERGLVVVAVVHDLNLAARYADHVALMASGRVAFSGPPAEVLRPAHVKQCFDVDVVAIPLAGHDVPVLLVTG